MDAVDVAEGGVGAGGLEAAAVLDGGAGALRGRHGGGGGCGIWMGEGWGGGVFIGYMACVWPTCDGRESCGTFGRAAKGWRSAGNGAISIGR